MQSHWRILTGEQVRAARSLARMEQVELARRTQLSVETIKRLERIRGPVDANIRTLNAIGAAFEQIGIRFDSGEGGGEGVWRVRRLEKIATRERDRSPPSDLHRLIYHGRLDDRAERLDEHLAPGSDAEIPAGITGAGFECGGRILHAIEGEASAVRQLFGAIASDARHTALTVVENRTVSSRLFYDWSGCDSLSTAEMDVLRREPALKDGFRPDLLSPASALGLLIRVGEIRHPVTEAEKSLGASGSTSAAFAMSA